MSLTEQDLDNLSNLARITVKPEEKQKMLADMQAILGYVSEINEVEGNLARGEEVNYNVVREDVVTNQTASNTVAILNNAPKVKDGYVEVEQVLK
jgi:aspartyl-tRNA(Asn)/glutamyl-tRNA(Gln) amidotransferase subunit C